MDRLGSELARLEEESEFLHKLLTERASSESAGDSPTEDKGHGAD